jgi:O-antigen ligase
MRMGLTLGLLEAIVGIAEQLLGPSRLVSSFGFPYNDVVEVVHGLLRSFGTMLDPFNYAGLVAVGLVFALFGIRRGRVQVLVLALLFAGLLSAFVRTSAPIALALILLALVRGARVMSAAFILSAAVVALGAFLLFSQTSGPAGSTATTLNGRTSEWSRVLHWRVLIAGQGVGEVGSGVNRALQGSIYQVQKQGSQPTTTSTPAAAVSIDSSYLAVISDVGLPGLLLLLALVLMIAGTAVRAARSDATSGWIVLGLLLVLLIDGFTRSSLTQFPFGNIVWFLLGAGLARAERDVARATQARLRPHELVLGDF